MMVRWSGEYQVNVRESQVKWEYFKERGEQYGEVWVNVAPFPFGSLIAKLA